MTEIRPYLTELCVRLAVFSALAICWPPTASADPQIIDQSALADVDSSGADDDGAPEERSAYSFTLYLDAHFYHDYSDFDGNNPYIATPRRAGLTSVNLAYLDAEASSPEWRSRVAIHDGDSIDAVYTLEPGHEWRYVQEAYAGRQLADGLWLDAGIFLSHIGSESLIVRDNWTYSHSLISDYSPYYQSGARLAYRSAGPLSAQLHIMNGWQNISDGRDPALGLQISGQLSEGCKLTYNNFIGDEEGTRIYNNLIVEADLSEHLETILAVDLGNQDLRGEGHVWWHGFSATLRHKVTKRGHASYRIELFSDPHGVVSSGLNGKSFRTGALSFGHDYQLLTGAVIWRNEIRVLIGRDEIYPARREGSFSEIDSYFVSGLILSL